VVKIRLRARILPAETLEACRDLLKEVLEGEILLRVSLHFPLPAVDGIELPVGEVA